MTDPMIKKTLKIMESCANGAERKNATRIFHTNLLRRAIAYKLNEISKKLDKQENGSSFTDVNGVRHYQP